MNEKALARQTGNLKALASKWGLIDLNKPVKMNEHEVVDLIDALLVSNYRRLEKAKRVYREQRVELDTLKQEPLWRFGKMNEAPPDFKQEYMQRMRERG